MDQNTEKKIAEFFSQFPLIKCSKYEDIEYTKKDGPQSFFYFIKEGFVRFYGIGPRGDYFSLSIAPKNTVIPIILNFISMKGICLPGIYMDCLSNVSLYKAPRDDVQKFFSDNNDLYVEVLKTSLIAAGTLVSKLPNMIYGSIEEKLASFLIYLADNFSRQESGRVFIEVILRHRDISSFIGASREATTNALGNFKRRKLISYNKHNLVILKMDKIEKIVDF